MKSIMATQIVSVAASETATIAGMKNNPSAATEAVNPSATDASISPFWVAASCAA